MDEYSGTHRHANEPDTPSLRVLACVKCGDRHTVDVRPIEDAIRQPLELELERREGQIARQASSPELAKAFDFVRQDTEMRKIIEELAELNHDREFWSDSNRTHTRDGWETNTCPDEGCIRYRRIART